MKHPPKSLPSPLALALVLVVLLGMQPTLPLPARALPIVDPGLFVILGVRSCGGGDGYCLLGSDCTLDRDFAHDEVGGHCDGLRFAFTPAAHFVCCKYVERSNTTLPGEPGEFVTTDNPSAGAAVSENVNENLIETELLEKQGQAGTPTSSPTDGVPGVLKTSSDGHATTATSPSTPPDGAPKAPSPTSQTPPEKATADGDVNNALQPSPAPEGADDEAGQVKDESDKVNSVDTHELEQGLELETQVVVSDEYKIKPDGVGVTTPAGSVVHTDAQADAQADAEVANVVPMEDPSQGLVKEAVLVSTTCYNSSTDVNPCWRTSFVGPTGTLICSGSLVSVDAAVTTAVCANRLLEAGFVGVSMRVGETALPVRDVIVHEDYKTPQELDQTGNTAKHDIALVRLLSPAGSAAAPQLLVHQDAVVAAQAPVGVAPGSACIACLPPAETKLDGKRCFALAARLNGLGPEPEPAASAVCAGTVETWVPGLMRLEGCDVATLKSAAMMSQPQAVLAREGAALLCDGVLVGLASTSVGSYTALAPHRSWLSRTLARSSVESGPGQTFRL